MSIKEIISIVPELLQYVVPGYLVLKLFQFLTSRKISEHTVVISCVISYLLNCVSLLIAGWFPEGSAIHSLHALALLSFAIGIVCAIILAWILQLKKMEEILVRYFGVSQDVDLLTNLLDGKQGANLVVHLKHGKHYIMGSYVGRDIKDGEQWIAIQCPQYFCPDGKKYYESTDDPDAKYVCRISDIEYLEVVK